MAQGLWELALFTASATITPRLVTICFPQKQTEETKRASLSFLRSLRHLCVLRVRHLSRFGGIQRRPLGSENSQKKSQLEIRQCSASHFDPRQGRHIDIPALLLQAGSQLLLCPSLGTSHRLQTRSEQIHFSPARSGAGADGHFRRVGRKNLPVLRIDSENEVVLRIRTAVWMAWMKGK